MFALRYSDTAGAMDLAITWVWFTAGFMSTDSPCLLNYTRETNLLSLLNDAATGYVSAPVGSGGTLQNSKCTVSLANSTVAQSGNTLTLNLAMTFAPSYAGVKDVYMYAAGSTGASSGWQQRGAWTVP